MSLPLSYPLRNLFRRPYTTMLTMLGIAIVVFACIMMLGVTRGIYTRLDITGEENNLLVISKKGQNVLFSAIEEDEIVELYSLPGLVADAMGDSLVSPEIMHVSFVDVDHNGYSFRSPVSIRGVKGVAFEVHKSIELVEGKYPEDQFEVVVGVTSHTKLSAPKDAIKVGTLLHFESRDWKVVGLFDTGGSLVESEIWVNLSDLQTVMRRRSVSFAVSRFESPEAVTEALKLFTTTGSYERFFKGWSEKGYYRVFSQSLSWVFWLSLLMVIAVTVAGALIGANTMYTAIINRLGEIGTLRVLGFGRGAIFSSLMIESVLIAIIGGIIGCGAGLALHGIPLKFSQGAFYITIDPAVAGVGMGLAALIGITGVLYPAGRGLSMTIIEALKAK